MNFGSANSVSVENTTKRRATREISTEKPNSGSGFRNLLQRGRLTEEDLDKFHSNILKVHKKRHYNVLAVSAVIFICFLILIYFTF
ncbi:hypothetical protein [Christiangramia sp. SM2212]|uniref:Uncharacterized protein n=1 Tax=Christiangramia sediminicola TaxID=3073267 RepID=A0ABU1EPZ7_9FLAO|nr:hypothetical protein [Christiangramia sp. SM2212]MDR5590049.1 hypothetical protein [Christiangramia sp. SM2212]